MVYIESNFIDPAFNLALEQYVFDYMPTTQEYFMLWQNENAIIIGKHQNTQEEINLSYVREHGIKVVRRLSGGGAVYHDLGNINFTFIADAGKLAELNLHAFCKPVLNALAHMGIDAELSGRNDITIGGKKFSGNSQYVKNGRILHHGTLMFHSDLSVVSEALRIPPDKYESKGFKSVQSSVTNISDFLNTTMTVAEFKQVLLSYMTENSHMEQYLLNNDDYEQIEAIRKSRYENWDWNFGWSPAFTVRKKRRIEDCGQLEVFLDIDHGKIMELDVRGDFFGDGMTKELAKRLKGSLLQEDVLLQGLAGFPVNKCFHNIGVEAFVALLID